MLTVVYDATRDERSDDPGRHVVQRHARRRRPAARKGPLRAPRVVGSTTPGDPTPGGVHAKLGPLTTANGDPPPARATAAPAVRGSAPRPPGRSRHRIVTPTDPPPPPSQPGGPPAPRAAADRRPCNSEFPGPILGGRVAGPDLGRRGGVPRPPAAGGPGRRRRRKRAAAGPAGPHRPRGPHAGAGGRRLRLLPLRVGADQDGPVPECVAVASGAPYNVLVIGSDSRVGRDGRPGRPVRRLEQRRWPAQRHHQDRPHRPEAGTASTLSIPRDTFVTLTGVPASSGVSIKNKINAAFAGPNDPDPDGTGATVVTPSSTPSASPSATGSSSTSSGSGRRQRPRRHQHERAPAGARLRDCNANGVFSNSGPRHPADRLSVLPARGAGPVRGPATSSTTPTASGRATGAGTSAGSSARTWSSRPRSTRPSRPTTPSGRRRSSPR